MRLDSCITLINNHQTLMLIDEMMDMTLLEKKNKQTSLFASTKSASTLIQPFIRRTPLLKLTRNNSPFEWLGANGALYLKMENLQVSGTFKARAAYYTLLSQAEQLKGQPLVAMSGGNHALATAKVAAELGFSATICMAKTVKPFIIDKCKAFGANVQLYASIHAAKEACDALAQQGYFYLHPFDGEAVATGITTLAQEITEQCPDFDNLFVSVGGGGLAGAVARYVKQYDNTVTIYGVEPELSATMSANFTAKMPLKMHECRSIATTLSPPASEEYSYQLCQQYIDHMVLVSDDMLRETMQFFYEQFAQIIEPAGVASTAAILNHKDKLKDKKTVAILCGSNIGINDFINEIAT